MNAHKSINHIIDRLSYIEGHIRGIKKMLGEEKPCDEILIQFSAVQSALTNAAKLLLEDHFDHCIMDKVKDENLILELQNFKQALDKFIK